MRYQLDLSFDWFISANHIECVSFNDITEFSGESVGLVLQSAMPLLATRGGGTLDDICHVAREYDEPSVRTFFEELLAQGVLRHACDALAQSLCDEVQSGLNIEIWGSLPTVPARPAEDCNGVGFRIGRDYVLAVSREARSVAETVRSVFEWVAGKNWRKRGRLIFAPTAGDSVIPARAFLPAAVLRWAKPVLNHLLQLSVSDECIYVVGLSDTTVRKLPLRERKTTICTVGPFEPVLELHQQNGYEGEPFGRSRSSFAARYRAPVETWGDAAWAWGSSPNPTEGIEIAYAEAVERYCAGHYPRSKLICGSLDQSEGRVDPRVLLDFDDSQKGHAGLRQFAASSTALWLPAVEFFTERKAEMLADLCLYPFHAGNDIGPYYWASSSGMAAHTTRSAAIFHALLELIERDAFMSVWLEKSSPTHISEENLPVDLRAQIEVIESKGFRIDLLDIARREVPAVFVTIQRTQWPALCCGCAARPTYVEACRSAFNEAESALFIALHEKTEFFEISASDVRFPEDHGMLYYNPSNLKNASFLWESLETRTPKPSEDLADEPRRDTNALAKRAGIRNLYVVDYPSPNHDLFVVRLDSPDLLHVTFGYGMEPRSRFPRRSSGLHFPFPHPFA